MSHILVGFSTKKDDWISRLICWITGWRHSHVVLINADKTRIIESTSFPFQDPLTGELRDGVREVPIAYLMRRDVVEIRKIDHPHPTLVWQHAQKMAVEKVKYDHEYIGAWLLRQKSSGDDHKVTCNELVELACKRAGHELYPSGMIHTSPRDLYLISKEL